METRQLAKLLGALSVEPRLMILGGLVAAGDEGLTELDLKGITGLSANAVWTHLEFMTNTDIVNIKMNGMTKSHTINAALMAELIRFLNLSFGAGFKQACSASQLSEQEKI
jgi:hypothetical protein